jgi:ATP/maltotriose-dependent transcriptional regulator MalT
MPTDLVAARAAHWEDPNGALDVAVSAEATGRRTGDDGLVVRALALQGTIALNRGDLRTALALATDADKRPSDEAVARAELAALKSQLSFFSGSYADSLSHAEAAMAIADAFGDLALRVFVRRAACMVLGTVGVPGWAE